MDNNTLAIYIHELRNQCMHIQASFNIFNQAMAAGGSTGVLYGGQLVLVSASQISSLLWPARARARGRGEALRKALQLPEKHPLNDRRLTELWERSDEKLEEWIASTKGEQVIFDFVGDVNTIGGEQVTIKDESIYRAYNPNTHIYYYRGVAYNFQGVASALSDVGGRINAAYRQLFPEHAKAEDEARARLEAEAKARQEAAQAGQVGGEQAGDAAPAPISLDDVGAAANDAGAETAKTPAKKAPAKKAAKPAAKKTAAKKAPAKKAPAKKAAPKKAAAKAADKK